MKWQDAIKEQVDNQVWNNWVKAQMFDDFHLNDQVSERVRSEISNRIWGEINYQINILIANRVMDHLRTPRI